MQQPEVAAVYQQAALTEFRFAASVVLGAFKIPEPGNIELLDIKRVFDARARHRSLCAKRDVKRGLPQAEAEELSLLEKLAQLTARPIEKLKQLYEAGRMTAHAEVIKVHREGVQVFFHVCLERDREQLTIPAWCFGAVPTAPSASAPATVN